MLKVQRVYYYEYDHYTDENGQNRYNADITTDENEAREIDKDYRLASITEVEEFIGIGYDVIPVVEVQEGVYGWFECEYETLLGDKEYYSRYIFLQPNSEWELSNMIGCMDKMMK